LLYCCIIYLCVCHTQIDQFNVPNTVVLHHGLSYLVCGICYFVEINSSYVVVINTIFSQVFVRNIVPFWCCVCLR
jgi:hypothetical protein